MRMVADRHRLAWVFLLLSDVHSIALIVTMANASETIYDWVNQTGENTTRVPASFRRPQSVSTGTIVAVMFTGVTGTCANAVVGGGPTCGTSGSTFATKRFSKISYLRKGCAFSKHLRKSRPCQCNVDRGVTGTCANAVVFVVLIFARRHYGSHVNTFIANQSLMDLAACIFLAVGYGMMLPGTPSFDFGLGEVGNYAVCYALQSRVLAVVCKNAGIIGLLILSLI